MEQHFTWNRLALNCPNRDCTALTPVIDQEIYGKIAQHALHYLSLVSEPTLYFSANVSSPQS